MPYHVRVSTKISCSASVKDQSPTGSRTSSPESQRPGRRSRGAQPTSTARVRAATASDGRRGRMALRCYRTFRGGRSAAGSAWAVSTPLGRGAKLPASSGRRMTQLASMAERYERPAWVRRINAMGDSVGGARRLLPLDAEALLATAAASLGGGGGFGEFGDPRWRERFTSLVSAL